MIRITDKTTTGSLLLKEAVDIIKSSITFETAEPAPAQEAPEVASNLAATRLHLMQEIQELEAKIEEVNQLLCKTNLEYMVRFQLKDDLEYYHNLIENKRTQLSV